ncbi:spindle assembly abnormal protein 7-like [Physella acuta]|uniref:spindle assembly abnormal protein 7-like n=1 Tax=Physella acuta TaxID=109671 RepID=UPI0027DC65EC|nr:spindle assembly abnormal protein 7-like [Physella acuta]XP_059168071.1 spindle assembly abnormal protein 7-like [Physella acuta]
MDFRKELAVLKFISSVWEKDVNSILDLSDGFFYMHVLKMLEPKADLAHVDSYDDRLQYVKNYLQEFYGENVDITKYLNFASLLGETEVTEDQRKIELAKIGVVLLGIGVLSLNGKLLMESALKLPNEQQEDVLALIQSVLTPDSTEVMLTDKIEEVLKASHVPDNNVYCNEVYENDEKSFSPAYLCDRDNTPNKQRISGFHRQFNDLSSPFKALDIKSPSTPSSLINFTKSPQFIQKALLKKKDLDLRKLREKLNAEILLKEETQFALQDKLQELQSKDVEISHLRENLAELKMMLNSASDVQDKKETGKEMKCDLLKEQELSILRYKELCEQLETDYVKSTEEISSLKLKIAGLENEIGEMKKLTTTDTLHERLKAQEIEAFNKLSDARSKWDEEKKCLLVNLEVARGKNEELRQTLEELQLKHEGEGETMDVVLDIQVGELRCQLDETRQEKEQLLEKLEKIKSEVEHLKEQLAKQEHSSETLKMTNSSLAEALKIERDTNLKMKKRMDTYIAKHKDISVKYEALEKESRSNASEVTRLKTALRELVQKQKETASHECYCDTVRQKKSTTLARDVSVSSQDSCATQTSQALKPRLSSGYDSSTPSPRGAIPRDKSTTFTQITRVNSTCKTQVPQAQTTLTKGSASQGSRTSLQSIFSVKELLPGVLPNALSCASEPDSPGYQWDRLSHMKFNMENDCQLSAAGPLNQPKHVKTKTEELEMKTLKRKTPLKSNESENMGSSTKQRKSQGTVLYFPLDPNGPIYPPPKPIKNRCSSGIFSHLHKDSSDVSDSKALGWRSRHRTGHKSDKQ